MSPLAAAQRCDDRRFAAALPDRIRGLIALVATAYFAYGTNMCRAQMAYRCPGAGLIDAALLREHRFQIAGVGFGTLIPEEQGEVHGVVWCITDEDERALDRYEGVVEGMYRKERRRVYVRLGRGAPLDAVNALVYVAADASRGVPRVGYMEQVIACSEAHGLPPVYLSELRRWKALEHGEGGRG